MRKIKIIKNKKEEIEEIKKSNEWGMGNLSWGDARNAIEILGRSDFETRLGG